MTNLQKFKFAFNSARGLMVIFVINPIMHIVLWLRSLEYTEHIEDNGSLTQTLTNPRENYFIFSFEGSQTVLLVLLVTSSAIMVWFYGKLTPKEMRPYMENPPKMEDAP